MAYELVGVNSDMPHRSACVLPKRALDVMNTECIRLLKLTKDAVVPVSFTIPRKVIVCAFACTYLTHACVLEACA